MKSGEIRRYLALESTGLAGRLDMEIVHRFLT